MPNPDVYSPRTVRVALALITLGLVGAAVFLVNGWLTWLLTALAAITGCATITPPFRRP